MRSPARSLVLAGLVLAGLGQSRVAIADSSDLSASELADVLGVHWWVFSVPPDFHHGDSIGVEWVAANGSSPTQGSISVGIEKGDQTVKIFMRYDTDTGETMLKLARGERGGGAQSIANDVPFEGSNEISIGNGTEVKDGDILIKLDKKQAGQTTYSIDSGNTLKPGEVGLKVVVRRAVGF